MNVEKSNLAQRKGQTYLPKKLPHVIFYPASNRELWASLFVYVKFKSIFLYRQTGIYNKRKKRRLSAKERTDLSSPNACARDFVLIFLSQASTPSLRGPAIGFTQHDRLRSCCVDGWMDGRVVIFYPFRFSLFSSIKTSNLRWF